MPRLLKVMIPYAVAVLAALAIFVAGAFLTGWFTGRVLNPRFALQDTAKLAVDRALLQSLDAGKVDEARSLLILQEDGHIMFLDMMAPYLPEDQAKSICRIMQKIAKHRSENTAKYSATEASSSPEVSRSVAASLQNPAACRQSK